MVSSKQKLTAEPKENYNSTQNGQLTSNGTTNRKYDSKRRRLNDPTLSVERKDVLQDCRQQFTDFESALNAAGGYGRYQWMFLLIVQWSVTQFAGNYIIMPLATYVPDVTCSLEPGSEHMSTGAESAPQVANSNHAAGSTPDEIALQPLTHQLFCQAYSSGKCDNITWNAPYFHTIIEEWALICAFDYVPELINSIQTGGNFVALILVGILSDRLGRKSICTVCFALLLIVNPFSITATSWTWFAVSRCIVGALTTAAATVMFVWSMESVDTEHNLIMNIMNMWHIGYIVSSIIGYTTKTWRRYLIVVNIIGVPILFLFTKLVESPRWLIQEGKLEQAANALTRISNTNGKKLRFTAESLELIVKRSANSEDSGNNSKSIIQDAVDPSEVPKQSSCDVLQLFADPHLACCTVLLIFMDISVALIASSYLFQVSLFHGDPSLKFLIFGLLRITTAPIIYMFDTWMPGFGRREMVYIPFTIVAICMGVAASSKLDWLAWVTFMEQDNLQFIAMLTSAVLCNFLWVGLGQYSVELFPTQLRNTAGGVTAVLDPLAVIFVQQLVYMEHYWPPILMVIVLVNTTVAALIAYMLLPETKGHNLPDSIQEADQTLIQMHNIIHDDTRCD